MYNYDFSFFFVQGMGIEPTRATAHNCLRVACLPIPSSLLISAICYCLIFLLHCKCTNNFLIFQIFKELFLLFFLVYPLGFEPKTPSLTYHIRFYTNHLQHYLVRCYGLDYFFTMCISSYI